MRYKDFFTKLKKNELGNYYIFTGEEEYMMNLALKELKGKYISEDFETLNYLVLEGKNTDLDTLINATETLPFMSEKKLIVLKDISLFLKELSDKEKEELYKVIDKLGDFLILIFWDSNSSLNKNTKLFRIIKNNDRQVEFTKLFGQDMNNFVNSIVGKHEKMISTYNAKHFIEQTGYNSRDTSLSLYDLENELLKIIDYAKGKEIKKEDIDSILIKTVDTNIFEFLDSFTRKSIDKSLMLLNVMYDSGEPIQRIFFMMVRQVRLILGYLVYKEKGYDNNSIQKKLQIRPYEFTQTSKKARGYTIEELEIIMSRLVDIDRQMKTTIVDEKTIVESFLVEMANNAYVNK